MHESVTVRRRVKEDALRGVNFFSWGGICASLSFGTLMRMQRMATRMPRMGTEAHT